jgi:hypothetical protein
VAKAQTYLAEGDRWVVDLDLEKFFDRVNHDKLMGRVAKRVADKRLLKLLRAYLNAGVMENGLVSPTDEGTPQGGPLSPLLSNLVLDELDGELEERGHRLVRYADDCNIYVRTERAGKRVMESITGFITRKLKLKVNGEKSAVARPWGAKVSGLELHEREGAEEADRAAGFGPIQEAGPGADAKDARREPRADGRRSGDLRAGMARLFCFLPDPVGPRRPRQVDEATSALRRLEAVETRTGAVPGAASPGRK